MGNDVEPLTTEWIESRIHESRGQRVMLDSDLAQVYGVSARRLNEQAARHARRFPHDFGWRLLRRDADNLKSQIATSSLAAEQPLDPYT